MNKHRLSVVIPTYNERDNIPKILEKLKKILNNITHEVIFVDDNSPTECMKKSEISLKIPQKLTWHIELEEEVFQGQ